MTFAQAMEALRQAIDDFSKAGESTPLADITLLVDLMYIRGRQDKNSNTNGDKSVGQYTMSMSLGAGDYYKTNESSFEWLA